MKPLAPLTSGGRRFAARATPWLLTAPFSAVLCLVSPASAHPVYESQNEFFTTGDFNGDGILDVLVLDKSTGNARVGYMDAQGNLAWSMPLVTGTENASGCASGRFLEASLDGIAVTSADLNRVNLVDLSNSNSAPSPTVIYPPGHRSAFPVSPHLAARWFAAAV